MRKVTQRRKALHKFRIVFIARLATSKIQYRTEWTAPQAGKVKAAMVTQYCILSQKGWKIKMVKSP
ncbi:hypothetical protein SORBI_3005G067800 [Sorghum bicolor]|uniref:Uncharacterized protein n=1 Tax=Sorghum bicolor TaxID=4558 RepID=A0A1Z5RH36_SORBI|nr:hypothetical protein SORBI_3005G067800 [Sorghum bicolor]